MSISSFGIHNNAACTYAGKGLSDGVVAMLEQDAAAFAEVIATRALKRHVEAWRREADIRAMSCLNR